MGGDYIGFRYWTEPGPVINGINGFGQSFVLAAVYYSGTELIAVTAGESKRPHKDIPKVFGVQGSGIWSIVLTPDS